MILDDSLLDLYRAEIETHMATLNDGLLALERGQPVSGQCEALMRAAHSIKGAARIVGHQPAIDLAHVIEDCFVAVGRGQVTLTSSLVDILLEGVDLLQNVTQLNANGHESASDEVSAVVQYAERLRCRLSGGETAAAPARRVPSTTAPLPVPTQPAGPWDVRCAARVDLEWVSTQGPRLLAELGSGREISLDLADVRQLAPAGVVFFYTLTRAAQVQPSRLRLMNVSPRVRAFFSAAGIPVAPETSTTAEI